MAKARTKAERYPIIGLTTSPKAINSSASCLPSSVRPSTRFGTRIMRGSPCRLESHLIYQFKAPNRSLEIKARWCTWHNDQTGGSNRRDVRSRTGCRIDDRVIIVCGDLVEPTDPVGNRLIDQSNFVNRKLQFPRLGPSTRRPLRIGVNQGDTVPPFVQLRRHGDCQGGFSHTTFVLRYTNNTIHRRKDACILLTVLPMLRLLHGNCADEVKEQPAISAGG